MSSSDRPRFRKSPDERREEILASAAAIALADGLERITLRAVAARLGVRPGLITHYYPVAEDLVIAAFVRAAAQEREQLIAAEGDPMQRMARFAARIESPVSSSLSRLWLNARHLSRFTPALAAAIEVQEVLDRERLLMLIEDGVTAGVFFPERPFAACVRIFMAIDGFGAYINDLRVFTEPSYAHFVTDVAEWALRLEPGTLRAAVAALPEGPSDAYRS